MQFRLTSFGIALVAALAFHSPALAKKCGNNAAGFSQWIDDFSKEAVQNGIRQSTINAAFKDVFYNTKTIWADRNQKSFKLSYDEFLKKRGASAIISQGRSKKKANPGLFANIEARYGVPAGPLIAIWGMETGFGRFQGDQSVLSAAATLAYDCRRSEFFENQLYAALQIVQTGQLLPSQMIGARHGELGQMQFLPANYVKYGVDGDRDGHVNMISSSVDALYSTANYLKAHGWKAGAGYQPGEPNYDALKEWNAAQVYQKALAYMGKEIDK